MPTYRYHCETCREEFELFQNMSSSPIQECPTCRTPSTRQMGAGAGHIVKGGGGMVAPREVAPPTGMGCGGCGNCAMAS